MAVIIKIKKSKNKKGTLTPFQKKLLQAPVVSEKKIKKMEAAGKRISVKKKSTLQKLLLKGPTWTEEQYQLWLKDRKSLYKWRIK
jgi:hypothetical protein